MEKRLLIVLVLAGCTEHGETPPTDTRHMRTTCDATTDNPGGVCELACATFTQIDPVSPCAATAVLDSTADHPTDCTDTFHFEGVRGCCFHDITFDDTIHFAECD